MEEFERVKSVIVDQLGVDEEDVTMEASFVDDLGADSLDIVELSMGLETEFDLEIPDDQAEKISTVGDAVNYIKETRKRRMCCMGRLLLPRSDNTIFNYVNQFNLYIT